MTPTLRLELLRIFQDTTSTLAKETGLDPVERLILMEIVALLYKTGGTQGATASSVSRATGLPFETTRRRIRKIEERGFIEQTPDGIMVKDPDLLNVTYQYVMDEFVRRLAPLIRDAEAELGHQIG